MINKAMPALRISGLEKTFHQGARSLTIFKDLSLAVQRGEIIALVGQSGSGKSTLLHIAGLLDTPTAGQVIIRGQDAGGLPEKQRTILRRGSIGFVYQFHHLLPEFSALENVAMPLIIAGNRKIDAERKAESILSGMGLAERLHHRPATLSGGEQQRVAIARALANEPELLLADEPTGNLDPQTSDMVFRILLEQVRGRGAGALIATHNMELARAMDRALVLRNGVLVEV